MSGSIAWLIFLCGVVVQAWIHMPKTFSIKRIGLSMTASMGRHGENFKYLPILRGSPSNHFPRIVYIAGVYPELSPEDLLTPVSPPAAKPGQWTYDFADPHGHQLGSVAIPGSDIVTDCVDPIAVIAMAEDLGLSYSEPAECVVLIDRADRDFSPEKFYIFLTPENTLSIGWQARLQPGYEIMGRVIICNVPFLDSMQPPKSGFLEDDEEY